MNDIEQQELKKENESLKEEIRLLKKKTELLSITQPLNKLSQFLIDRMDAIIFIKDVTNDFRYFMVNQKLLYPAEHPSPQNHRKERLRDIHSGRSREIQEGRQNRH